MTVRVYQVGFGDCFLLTFNYPQSKRHVLIDFGTMGKPEDAGERLMERVATDIRERCDGKLHAVVATHRHKDHVSGFATRKKGDGPGDIIASCKPEVVVQPWTEDPKAQPDAKAPIRQRSARQAFVGALHDMQQVAEHALVQASGLRGVSKSLQHQLAFLGEDNLGNASAVRNLMTMGKRPHYVHCGSRSGLERLLPGVTTHVLGPPTLEQHEAMGRMRTRDNAEFWHLYAHATDGGPRPVTRLFPKAKTQRMPPYARWFRDRVRRARGESLLELVRSLDHALNNTSIILLFEVGGRRLLFPGDAQIENWEYVLHHAPNRAAIRRKLEKVDFYKVGHHGSLNATPKTVWNSFAKRSPPTDAGRMRSVVSTMGGKHGSRHRDTEVPRRKLVEALEAETDFFTTQTLRGRRLSEVFEYELARPRRARSKK
ncbi:MAG: hypothetical protein KC731_36465 [Myxococcales bacterium]|nr:hypothetical protein [Myxococcales bacterium]